MILHEVLLNIILKKQYGNLKIFKISEKYDIGNSTYNDNQIKSNADINAKKQNQNHRKT